MNSILKNFLAVLSVLLGPFIIGITYVTNFSSSFVANVVVLTGAVLLFGGAIYLFIKFMRWLVN